MPKLKVPESYTSALQQLAGIDDAAIDDLVQALESEQPTVGAGGLADHVSPKAVGIPKEALSDIIDVLVSLSSWLPTTSLSASDLAEGVATSDDLPVTVESRRRLQVSLARLLEARSVKISGKAYGILSEHTNVFYQARILTDIRPVFLNGGGPSAAIIVHSLKMIYRHEDSIREIFLALTPEDVRNLEVALARAKEKANSLRPVVEKAGLTYLEVKALGEKVG